jgi:hypothetical protein
MSDETRLTKEEIHVLVHALGGSKLPQTELGWRNRYFASEHDAAPNALKLKGFLEGSEPQATGAVNYRVTPAGIEFLRGIGHKVTIR